MSEASFQQPDRRRPEPLWYQVEEAIRAIVKSGEWATGDQIPAEDRLCALFGVSRITLRHALRNLEESGLLRREHGRVRHGLLQDLPRRFSDCDERTVLPVVRRHATPRDGNEPAYRSAAAV